MAQLNEQYLNENNNPQSQVRQNLINQPQEQQEQIPIQQILAPPLVHPPVQYNIMLGIPQQQTVVPLVPISQYKWPLEIWFFFGCLIQMIWFSYNCVHLVWAAWYIMIGFWRHGFLKRKVRFWGELMNIMIWIMTNCYVFSGHRGAIFPFAIIMENFDYYFIGGNLVTIYFSYFSYVIGQSYADFKLYIIRKKLQQRRKIFIQNSMQKFLQNETNHSTELKQMSIATKSKPIPTQSKPIPTKLKPIVTDQMPIATQESVQQNMIRDQIPNNQNEQISKQYSEQNSNKQQQINNNKDCLICFEEFVQCQGESQKQTVRLQCHHRYHYSCLKKYIELGNIHCPACRKILIE